MKFVGEIGEQQKSEFLGDASALLFPVDWPQPFGLVVIEAMACGTPVIAYPEGSVPEVIDEGTTSFMVRSTDEAGAALGKARMLDRTALRQRFEQRFSAQRMASDYVALYRRLACTARFRPLIGLPHVRRAPQIEVGAR